LSAKFCFIIWGVRGQSGGLHCALAVHAINRATANTVTIVSAKTFRQGGCTAKTNKTHNKNAPGFHGMEHGERAVSQI
jgi:hypothetical protein